MIDSEIIQSINNQSIYLSMLSTQPRFVVLLNLKYLSVIFAYISYCLCIYFDLSIYPYCYLSIYLSIHLSRYLPISYYNNSSFHLVRHTVIIRQSGWDVLIGTHFSLNIDGFFTSAHFSSVCSTVSVECTRKKNPNRPMMHLFVSLSALFHLSCSL